MRLYTKIFLPAVFCALASCGLSSNNSGLPQATLPLPENDTTGIVVSTTNQMGYVVIEASAGVVPVDMDLVVQVVDAAQNPAEVGSAGCEGEVPVCPSQNTFGECRQSAFDDGSTTALIAADVTDYLWIAFQDFATCETTDAMEVQISDTDIEIVMGDIEEITTDVSTNSPAENYEAESNGDTATGSDFSGASGDADAQAGDTEQVYPPAPEGLPQPVKPKKRPRPKPKLIDASQTPSSYPDLPPISGSNELPPLPLENGEAPMAPLDAPLLPPPGESNDAEFLPPGEPVLPPLDFQEPPPPEGQILPPLVNDVPITELWPHVRDYRGAALFNVLQNSAGVLHQRIFPDHTIILFATDNDVLENADDPELAYYLIRADRIEIDKPMIVTASIFVGKALGTVEVFEDLRPAPNTFNNTLLWHIVFVAREPQYERVFPVDVNLVPLPSGI